MLVTLLSRAFRAIPDIVPGKGRLARLALRPFRDATVLEDKFGNDLYLPSLQEPIALGIFATGVYEPDTVSTIVEHLPEHGTFLDVGANVGAISLAIAAQRPAARIVSVEADPTIAKILRENAQRNRRQIRVIECAAGPQNGSVSFYRAPEDKFGMGSTGPQFSDDTVTLPQCRLDDLLTEPVHVIKLNVEGGELGALLGLRQTIERYHPVIVFEFADWAEARISGQRPGDAQAFVLTLGYELTRMDSGEKIPAPLTCGAAMVVAKYNCGPAMPTKISHVGG